MAFENIIEKYAQRRGWLLAKKIEDSFAIVVKPRPFWCPKWLYERILKETVEIVQTDGHAVETLENKHVPSAIGYWKGYRIEDLTHEEMIELVKHLVKQNKTFV